MNIGNKVPVNELSLQHQIARVNDEFIDALAACSYALEEYVSYDDKLELIHDIDMDLSKLELKKQFKIKRIVYDKYRDCTERYVA